MSDYTLLMVEDSLSMAALYRAYLAETDYQVRIVTDLVSAKEELAQRQPDLVLLDVELPDGSGLELLDIIQTTYSSTEVVIMTANGSSAMAMKAIEDGAFDFLNKPFDAARLTVTLDNAIAHKKLATKVAAYADIDKDSYCGFIGSSIPMQTVYRIIDSLAVTSATAFIVGESGTGKELAAEAIHLKSPRASKNFHAINCAAIPKDLMESELFGHTKGAFTGATADRDGAATIADGGTLFLDEICEMDLELQKKLLRFIQTSTYQKVGSNKQFKVDIRIVCATNRDPLQEVRAGRFREDLYYRLHVVPLELPPLRFRGDDIGMIGEFFLKKYTEDYGKAFKRFASSARKRLQSHTWPGNVRELQNVIENAVVLTDGNEMNADMLSLLDNAGTAVGHQAKSLQPQPKFELDPPQTNASTNPYLPAASRDIKPLWLVEKETIEAAMHICGGSVNKAAGRLEVAPSTLYRKIQSWKDSTLNANTP